MTPEEEEDRRLRAEAEGLALADLAAPRRVELAPDPELDAPVSAGPSTDPADYEQDYQDALAAHGPMPEDLPIGDAPPDVDVSLDDENTDLTSGVAGVDGIHDYDFEALPREEVGAPDLARDDMEPLGDITEAGQMFAPSGDRESIEQRFARLGVGGDFAAQIPDPNAEIYGVATDDDPTLPGRMRDEPEAVDNPTEESAEPDILDMMGSSEEPATLYAADLAEKRDRERAEVDALPISQRLDAGLPSEEEIAGARDDAGESVLHRIANAIRAYSGHATRDYDARGDALQQQRTTGLERRTDAKAAGRADEAEAASSAAAAQRSAELAERGLGLRERMTAAAEQTAASTSAAREASTTHTQLTDRQTQEQREAMTRVDSSESQSARRAWEAGLARLPDAMRERFAAIIPPEELATMNATQLEGPLRMVERISVGARGSGGRGGGSARAGTARDVLRQHLIQTGLSEDAARLEVDALDDAHVQSRIAAQQALRDSHASRAGDEEGRMVVYGDAEGSPVTADARTFGTPAALNNYQDGLASAGDTSTSLAELERVYDSVIGTGSAVDRAGAWARLQVSGEVDEPIGMLMGAVTEMARTGVINPGAEASRIRGMLPDPSSLGQMTSDQFRSRMRQFRSALAAQVTQRARMHGISEEDTNRLLRSIIGGGFGGAAPARRDTAPATAAPSDTIRVRQPDGSYRTARRAPSAAR